jgi:hypothetical protein
MAIAGHVSRAMLKHYSPIRRAAKRAALDAISTPLPQLASGEATKVRGDVHQNVHQIQNSEKDDTRKLLN